MNPWDIIGWLLLALIVGGVAALIVSWELERRRAKPPVKGPTKTPPKAYVATRNIRPGKGTIYVHGRTSRGEYLLSFDPAAPPWVESAAQWQQRAKREDLQAI